MESVMQKYFDQLLQSTAEILRFDSSLKPAEDGCPFGKETADCLQFFLSLAESMGFETHNYDNYVGEVVFGKGKPFAILAHLDVVPAGSGWDYDPFGGIINDEPSATGVTGKKLWGRGAMDDKSPAVACLYAMKALKDEGFVPARTLKLIVGCNEESGWKCIDYYNKVAEMPEEGFTPDADFPVIYAEKGILHISFSFPINDAPMSALNAGERVNMVCANAEAFIDKKTAELLVDYENTVAGTTLSYDNTTNLLKGCGKSAHGSTPHKGANALQAVLRVLAQKNEDCRRAYEFLFEDSAKLTAMQDETGNLTFSPNLSSFKNGVLTITADIRFPATHTKQEVLDIIQTHGVEYEVLNYQAPLYNDPNGKLITTLMDVYKKVTGKDEKPIAIGGGTYARALKCGCAFGPEFPESEPTIHQANEFVSLADLQMMADIYYEAIKAVSKP